jgi:hypothetical protein
MRALLGKGRMQLLHHARRIGRQVEIGGAGLDAGQQSVRPQCNSLHIRWFRQRREDHFGLACERSRTVRPDRSGIEMMAGRLPVQIVDDEFEPGLLDVGGHPSAHSA